MGVPVVPHLLWNSDRGSSRIVKPPGDDHNGLAYLFRISGFLHVTRAPDTYFKV